MIPKRQSLSIGKVERIPDNFDVCPFKLATVLDPPLSLPPLSLMDKALDLNEEE